MEALSTAFTCCIKKYGQRDQGPILQMPLQLNEDGTSPFRIGNVVSCVVGKPKEMSNSNQGIFGFNYGPRNCWGYASSNRVLQSTHPRTTVFPCSWHVSKRGFSVPMESTGCVRVDRCEPCLIARISREYQNCLKEVLSTHISGVVVLL